MIRSVEFELESGAKLTIFLSGNIAVHTTKDANIQTVLDGLHNNGGWKVKGTYLEVVNAIKYS
jgi:hypothetical protein